MHLGIRLSACLNICWNMSLGGCPRFGATERMHAILSHACIVARVQCRVHAPSHACSVACMHGPREGRQAGSRARTGLAGRDGELQRPRRVALRAGLEDGVVRARVLGQAVDQRGRNGGLARRNVNLIRHITQHSE